MISLGLTYFVITSGGFLQGNVSDMATFVVTLSFYEKAAQLLMQDHLAEASSGPASAIIVEVAFCPFHHAILVLTEVPHRPRLMMDCLTSFQI